MTKIQLTQLLLNFKPCRGHNLPMFSSVSVSFLVRLVCHAGQGYFVIGAMTDL